jgi:hypothetical protein
VSIAPDPFAGWADSGAMSLTGRADGPPLPPPTGMPQRLFALARRIADASEVLGRRVAPDPCRVVAERASISGLTRQGRVSCGGSARLIRAQDDWVAVSMARDDDVDLVHAWLEAEVDRRDPWRTIETRIAEVGASEVVERAALLGLPVSRLREVTGTVTPPVNATAGRARRSMEDVLVVDLSSLWAGPLCGQVLRHAGARVVKVEDIRRPDGARRSAGATFDRLNSGKQGVALDLGSAVGRSQLHDLVSSADVVIEASRPRALQQLSIDAETMLDVANPSVWVSITGYGRYGEASNRVAFGDDAAVAGGLVAWDDRGPVFCADAIADPATGLAAAALALEALTQGVPRLLDVAMARVAADLAGPCGAREGLQDLIEPTAVRSPRAPAPVEPAPRLGQHNLAVLGIHG